MDILQACDLKKTYGTGEDKRVSSKLFSEKFPLTASFNIFSIVSMVFFVRRWLIKITSAVITRHMPTIQMAVL